MPEPDVPCPKTFTVDVALPRLPAKQQQALLALLSASSVREAAASAHVSLRSLYRWLAEDERFQACYHCARRQLMDQALCRLQESMGPCVEILSQIAQTRTEPSSSRVAACRALLEYGFKGGQLAQLWRLEERLNQLGADQATRQEPITIQNSSSGLASEPKEADTAEGLLNAQKASDQQLAALFSNDKEKRP